MIILEKNIYEVMILKEKKKDIDKNFFKAMNYELAGEIGVIDDEDMKKNRYINSKEIEKEKDNQMESRH